MESLLAGTARSDGPDIPRVDDIAPCELRVGPRRSRFEIVPVTERYSLYRHADARIPQPFGRYGHGPRGFFVRFFRESLEFHAEPDFVAKVRILLQRLKQLFSERAVLVMIGPQPHDHLELGIVRAGLLRPGPARRRQ